MGEFGWENISELRFKTRADAVTEQDHEILTWLVYTDRYDIEENRSAARSFIKSELRQKIAERQQSLPVAVRYLESHVKDTEHIVNHIIGDAKPRAGELQFQTLAALAFANSALVLLCIDRCLHSFTETKSKTNPNAVKGIETIARQTKNTAALTQLAQIAIVTQSPQVRTAVSTGLWNNPHHVSRKHCEQLLSYIAEETLALPIGTSWMEFLETWNLEGMRAKMAFLGINDDLAADLRKIGQGIRAESKETQNLPMPRFLAMLEVSHPLSSTVRQKRTPAKS